MSVPLALGTLAFLLAVIWGKPLISWLRKNGVGKQIRVELLDIHQSKMGTPTMGGLMIVIPVLIITLVLNIYNFISSEGLNVIGRSILVPLFAMVTYGVLGGVDDLIGVKRIASETVGMLGRHKILAQTILAFLIALALYLSVVDISINGIVVASLPFGQNLHSIAIPGVPQKIDIGLLYVPAAMFIIVGSANAVNFTDGLDGLAGWTTAICFVAYGVIAFLQQQIYLVTFCFIMVGALLAFLWYNAYPAELFMGDVGSQAIGATLAVVALMTGQWLLLPLIGLIFVGEMGSVIIQVAYFKWTKGKRFFKRAPIHHHFELVGWSQTQIVQRFWLIGMLAGMLGVALALL